MLHDDVDRVLKKVHRDSGLLVLEFDEGPTLCYQWDEKLCYMTQHPQDELPDWTLRELDFINAEEYQRICNRKQRERTEEKRLKIEDEDYHNMWQLYHKYGGEMPTKFPSEVLIVARACQWDSPEYVDVTLKGVVFHVTKKDV